MSRSLQRVGACKWTVKRDPGQATSRVSPYTEMLPVVNSPRIDARRYTGQFYGIGESGGKPIPSLKSDRPISLQKRHARALKKSLSPLFSSSPSEGRIDQIPEQLRKMKKLTFKGVQNPKTKQVMDSHCSFSQQNVNPNQNNDSIEPVGASDPSQEIHYQVKVIFPRGSRAYNDFFMRTPLGRCVARMQKKYFIHSNISMIEYHRQRDPKTLGNIIIHFDYEE